MQSEHLMRRECPEPGAHPEIPMTMAGVGVPSLMMHQFLLSALSRASSSCSCCKMGRPLSLSSLQAARLEQGG